MTASDPILDSDLDAYVDGQLGAVRRLQVERFLAGNPPSAARVMADISLRSELRLLMGGPPPVVRQETREAARRLERSLAYGRLASRLQKVAAIGLFITAGWVANSTVGPFHVTGAVASEPPPAHVEDAVRAHQTSQLREHMTSQPAGKAYDPEDIRAATAIVLPQLPSDWKVIDVQIFPSQFGPSVEMAVETDSADHLSLFAVRPGVFAVTPVKTYTLTDAQAADWQIGDVAYALVSSTKAPGLASQAERLSKTLY